MLATCHLESGMRLRFPVAKTCLKQPQPIARISKNHGHMNQSKTVANTWEGTVPTVQSGAPVEMSRSMFDAACLTL